MYFALPQEYRVAPADDLRERISRVKQQLGHRLCVLVHHYQRVEVVPFADHLGDSYGLSKSRPQRKKPKSSSSAVCTLWRSRRIS